jgi:probable F420-dependent oxidoreductase
MTELGSVGAWCGLLAHETAPAVREYARRLEAAGYGTIWYGEALGREAFGFGGLLLSATESVRVASGIANIWVRDAVAMHNGAATLAEAYDGRFVLGIGVSHRPLVDKRGHAYARPLAAMREYLEAYESARYGSPEPPERVPLLLSALGPKMLDLAGRKADGAHPYFVPIEHTTIARDTLGEGPVLAPEQAVVVSDDPDVARTAARRHMQTYLGLPNYRNNLLRLGYDEATLDGNPDSLVDDLVAWGSPAAIATRIQDHFDRGADHVAVQVLPREPGEFPIEDHELLAKELGWR